MLLRRTSTLCRRAACARVVVVTKGNLRHKTSCADGEAWQRLRAAAEEPSNAEAKYSAGLASHAGDWDGAAVPQDAHSAKQWLRESAELGHARAQAALGRIVYDEMEALRSLAQAHDYQAAAEAERWLTRASEQGELDATRTLIPLYITKGDLASALRMTAMWLQRSVLYSSIGRPRNS